MSDTKKEETKEERKDLLKAKLRNKMNQKKVGRMNRHQKKKEMDKYCDQLGISPDQLEQFKALGAIRKTKK